MGEARVNFVRAVYFTKNQGDAFRSRFQPDLRANFKYLPPTAIRHQAVNLPLFFVTPTVGQQFALYLQDIVKVSRYYAIRTFASKLV
jgi:hypothetical protein